MFIITVVKLCIFGPLNQCILSHISLTCMHAVLIRHLPPTLVCHHPATLTLFNQLILDTNKIKNSVSKLDFYF